MTILLFVMLGVFVFMMFRRNKKTQQQQAQSHLLAAAVREVICPTIAPTAKLPARVA